MTESDNELEENDSKARAEQPVRAGQPIALLVFLLLMVAPIVYGILSGE